jgi:hypothetical protein
VRKFEQRQILEVLGTLEEAQAIGLYADCQDGALGIGEFIEQIKGEGTQTVALLEEYCELIYKASLGEANQKVLKKQIIKIENSVKSELKPDRIEMVFLSYKASMSDSIESIYHAAKEDPNCDAYWIPIPYYERNPDGTLGKLLCEDAGYYKETIECTNWMEYDIEQRRPDVIFTFAPYDAYNHVSTVHPDYYCERLRDLTNLLVYVPYFVTITDLKPPFTTCRGALFAHLVVVQSEAVRQCYIRDYKEFVKNGYSEEVYGRAKDKFVALGSPKFDAVLNAKREDFTLPDEWSALLTNPDGTRKITVLYNTSVTASINNTEQYLKKLRFVLGCFRGRDDIVLWWRPHPLAMNTFMSMALKYAGEYKQMVEEYRSDGGGIYDDTPDLHRAIACTDAYYGDWSSLVVLYGATGKLVVVQDLDFIANDLEPEETVLTFNNLIFDSCGKGLSYSTLFNGLFQLDFNNYKAKLITRNEHAYHYSAHINLIEIENKIILFPYYSSKIVEYDITNCETKEIELSKSYAKKIGSIDTYTIFATVCYNETIYAFGQATGIIVAYNSKIGEVQYHTELRDVINDKLHKGNSIGKWICLKNIEESKVFIALHGSGYLVEYDLELQEVMSLKYSTDLVTSNVVEHDGEFLWILSSKHDSISKWNYKNNESFVYNKFPDNIQTDDKKTTFAAMINCGAYLLMLPAHSNMAVMLNKSTGEMTHADAFPIPGNKEYKHFKYCGVRKEFNGKYYIIARFNSTVYEFDPKHPNNVIPYRFIISENDYKEYLQNAITTSSFDVSTQRGFIIYDSFISGSPANYLRHLLPTYDDVQKQQREFFIKESNNVNTSSGESIWYKCKSSVIQGE